MTWKDNLRPASFRGVGFHTDDRDFESGRRIHNHEFPKRNSNFPEDMGRATREFSVTAYVIGDDYMARRDRLIRACEREGAGTYVDHWGLGQRVVCTRIEVTETREDGRFCRFKLKFLDAGEGAMPVSLPSTAALLGNAASALVQAVTAAFAASMIR